MKILVCGGRDYKNRMAVERQLSARVPTVVIEGGSTGADSFARRWAREHASKVSLLTVPADWQQFGKLAGPLRNQRMLDEKPDLVLAFPGGKGTADMVRRAKKAGVPVIEVGSKRLQPRKG